MTGTTHFLAGAAVGKLTKNPILAIVIGFFIHFLMDMIPHWDLGYLFCSRWTCYVMAMSDPLFGILVFVIIGLVMRFDKRTWMLTFLGGLASLAPDAGSVLIKTFHIEQLRWFMEFHAMAHTLHKVRGDVFAWNEVSFTIRQMIIGLAVQVPFLAVSIWVLIKKFPVKNNNKKKK